MQTAETPGPRAEEGVLEGLSRNESRQLVARVRGRAEPVVDCRVARCFPWSIPASYVSVRDKDGKEVALVRDLEALDSDSRRLMEGELREKVFNPKIRRVREFKNEFGVISLDVETDRGDVTFQIRSRDEVRVLSATRALFRDADGNTYEVEDLGALDAASRRYLEDYL